MRVVFILVPLAIVGCSALTSLDDLEGQSEGGGDDVVQASDAGSDVVQASDAGSDVVQTSDASDAGGNLVTNGSFENGNGGCGANWGNGYGMTFTRVSPGHTGNSACLVCIQGSGLSYQIDAIATMPVQAGNYYAEAWIDTPWDGGAATQKAGIQVRLVGDAGTITGCIGDGTSYCQGTFVTPNSGWAPSSTTFVVAGSGGLQIDIHSYDGTASSCFALDDVALYAQ